MIFVLISFEMLLDCVISWVRCLMEVCVEFILVCRLIVIVVMFCLVVDEEIILLVLLSVVMIFVRLVEGIWMVMELYLELVGVDVVLFLFLILSVLLIFVFLM